MGDLSSSDQKLLSDMGTSFTDLAQTALDGGKAYEDAQSHLRGLIEAHRGIHGTLDETGRALEGLSTSLENQNEVAQDAALNGAVLAREEAHVGDAAAEAAEKAKKLAEQTKELKDKQEAAREAVIKLNQALVDQAGNAVDADSAESRYQASVDAASASIKENGRSLDLNTPKGRANSDALRTLASDAMASAKAHLTNGESVASVTKKMTGKGGARDAFITTAVKMGASRVEAEKLADKYGLTRDKVDALNKALGHVPESVTSNIYVGLSGPGAALIQSSQRSKQMADIKWRAKGGPVQPGTPYAVGDNPDGSWNKTTELFWPTAAGQILSAPQSRAMLSSGAPILGAAAQRDTAGSVGTEDIVVHSHFYLDGRQIDESVRRYKRQVGA
jgi:hypothetical protein